MKYIYLFILLILVGCTSDDGEETIKCQIQNTHYTFLELFEDDYGNILNNPASTGLVEFLYNDNNSIIRANGGLRTINPATGFRFVFVDNVYDSISHKSNSIEVYKKSADLLFNDDIVFELNNNSLPNKKITSSNSYTFTYSSNNILVESINNNGIRSTYHYDNKNLIRIETILSDITLADGTKIVERTVDTFNEYDDKLNPFKNLFYIRGAFFRSLSENNYKIHNFVREKRIGDDDWQIRENHHVSSNFEYDENNLPKFGEYNCN